MKKIILLCFVFTFVVACGGRTPTPQSAQSITQNFFKTYGKKFKDSFYGQSEVQSVSINDVREVSFHKAEVDAIVLLKNQSAARVLVRMKQTPPLGWSVISWETLGSREN